MLKTEKPWGYEEIWAKTTSYVGKIITIFPESRLSLQFHEKKEETIYVISGTLRVWSSKDEEDFIDINPGGVFHVVPGQVHRFGCPSKKIVTKIIEVSTTELDDVVRISDDYGR